MQNFNNHNKFNAVSERFAKAASVARIVHESLYGLNDSTGNSLLRQSLEKYLTLEVNRNPLTNFSNQPSFVRMLENHNNQKKVNEGVKKFKKGLGNLKLLVDLDWYVSTKVLDGYELNTISELSKATNKNNIQQIEEYIIASFDERKIKIFDYLRKTFPSRINLLEEIENLYKSNYYSALIILCYSQADGICMDQWKIGFFDSDKKNGYKLKIKKLKTRKKQFSRSISNQLRQNKNEITRSSFNSKYNDQSNVIKSFNRHLVMHGHSIEYGTKTNAIRAILLLEFICDLVNEHYKINSKMPKV